VEDQGAEEAFGAKRDWFRQLSEVIAPVSSITFSACQSGGVHARIDKASVACGAILPVFCQARGAVFKNFVRQLLRKNRGATRNVLPSGLSDPSVLACTYLVLLRLLRPSLQAALTAGRAGAPREKEAPVAFPTEAFLGDHVRPDLSILLLGLLPTLPSLWVT
jgi:hypothetical protein